VYKPQKGNWPFGLKFFYCASFNDRKTGGKNSVNFKRRTSRENTNEYTEYMGAISELMGTKLNTREQNRPTWNTLGILYIH